MAIERVLSFLTHPGKHKEDPPQISAAVIPKKGKLFNMMADIFSNSETDCKIPIIFISESGDQENDVRDEIVSLISSKSIEDGRVLANRLQMATTEKSGMGLLFFTIGSDRNEGKIVISRFPADEGIVAERSSKILKVEFVEEVFLKSDRSYKSAMYKTPLKHPDLWTGVAIDKQVNHEAKEVAAYWINDFLKSDFQTTPRQGTKRLAMALKNAIDKSNDPDVKHEITSSAKLAKNIPANAMTIAEFCDRFHFSEKTTKEVCKQVSSLRLLEDRFVFDCSEFDKHLSYKLIELDNGAILSAQAANFDECFESEKVEGNNNDYRFTTKGTIVEEKLRRSK